jgi:hypothetical protein
MTTQQRPKIQLCGNSPQQMIATLWEQNYLPYEATVNDSIRTFKHISNYQFWLKDGSICKGLGCASLNSRQLQGVESQCY